MLEIGGWKGGSAGPLGVITVTHGAERTRCLWAQLTLGHPLPAPLQAQLVLLKAALLPNCAVSAPGNGPKDLPVSSPSTTWPAGLASESPPRRGQGVTGPALEGW